MGDQITFYKETLARRLIELCAMHNSMGNGFLEAEELDERWKKSAPEYMVDAVPEIPKYPNVAIAWACYYGMGAAHLWDKGWKEYKKIEDIYIYFREKRGFDYMDEYIVGDLLKLKPKEAKELNVLVEQCSQLALTLIRKEGIEAQSIEAFHTFAATTDIFFKLGVSLELSRLGYKYEKMKIKS